LLKNDFASRTAAIFGCSGTTLNGEEDAFFRRVKPYGFILFARNCETPDQIRALIAALRATVGEKDVPILIDQEGGRVARLGAPHWRKTPAAGTLAALPSPTNERAITLNARLMAADLANLGITVDCAPLLDVPAPNCHDIIGDRAFGDTPEKVITLGRAMMRGLLDGGIFPVIKHLPGHGRALADSHLELPIVHASIEELRAMDFPPFYALRDAPYAMTAHVLYSAIDSTQVATFSPTVIQLIREELGFDGLLMSDDFSMKALTGSFAERTQLTFAAGCDLALHCNGKMEEMTEIAEHAPRLSAAAVARAERIHTQATHAQPFDGAAALEELRAVLA
jgi:beta-N-acetylhexosaminidase